MGYEKFNRFDNERALSEKRKAELHFSDLHDENEDQSGEKVDIADGKPIDNSTYTGMEELQTIEPDGKSEDVLGALSDEEDEAAGWLREQGGNDRNP